MKAAVCHEFGKPLVIEEVQLGEPQAGEVKVKLAACAICHSDISYMEGAWGGRLPALYGHEAAGVVETVGVGVKNVQPGDPVVVTLIRSCGRCFFCAQGQPHLCESSHRLDRENVLHTQDGTPIFQAMRSGAFAEYVVVDSSQAIPIPADLPLDLASLLACGVITGLGAVVNTAKVPAGSSVVVIGAGGVGLNSVQGARLSGAQPVIAVDVVDSKLEAARAFGATETINAASEDALARVRALTNGRGADYVFVTVGIASALKQGLLLLRKGGTAVMVGLPPSGEKLRLEVVNFADANQILMGNKMGSTRPSVDIPRLAALYREGRLKLDELITNRYPLEQINEAIAEVKLGKVLRNVIVFQSA